MMTTNFYFDARPCVAQCLTRTTFKSFIRSRSRRLALLSHNPPQKQVILSRTTKGKTFSQFGLLTGLLQLLQASVPDAALDSVERSPPPKCHPGTRKKLLEEIQHWIHRSNKKICWL